MRGPIESDLLGVQIWGRRLDRQADDDLAGGGFARARHTDLTTRLALTSNRYHEA